MTNECEAPQLDPWLGMWFTPRKTIQQVVENNPERWVYLLAALAGIEQVLGRVSSKNMGDKMGLSAILLLLLFAGPIAGIISFYVNTWLIEWTGGWIGGKASLSHVRAAWAWSFVPVIFSLVLLPFKIMMFGNDLFQSVTPIIDAHPYAYTFFGVIELACAIWTMVLMTQSLAQVQKFSAWKALGNIALAGLSVLIALFLLMLPFILL